MTATADTSVKRSRNPLHSLWFWVVLAFLLLITAWSTLITYAVKNAPEKIEAEPDGEKPTLAQE